MFMHKEESSVSLEMIATQLLDYFIQAPTGQLAIRNTASELQNIKSEYSSFFNNSLYSFVAVPFNYLSGNSQIVQSIDTLNVYLQQIIAEENWLKQSGYSVLDKIIEFVDNDNWALNAANNILLFALVKHMPQANDYSIRDSVLKKMLAEMSGKSFIKELKVALAKQKAKDHLQKTQAPLELAEEAEANKIELFNDDDATIEEESVNDDESMAVLSGDAKEQIFFSGDGTMITRRKSKFSLCHLPSPVRGFLDFFENDTFYYPDQSTNKVSTTPQIDDAEPWQATTNSSNTTTNKLQYSPISNRPAVQID